MKYDQCFVAYLDILGFENFVMGNVHAPNQKIVDYFELINNAVGELNQSELKSEIGSLIISDSVILSIKKTSDNVNNIQLLRELCTAIRKIQFKLALAGIWMRGGVSSGHAYFSSTKSQIVGPAYIDAYKLERQIAVFPRVILDSRIIVELGIFSKDELINVLNNDKNRHGLDDTVLYPWSKGDEASARMKRDVALFVDYLALAVENLDSLKTIVDILEKEIYQQNLLYPKFRWMVDYLLAKIHQVKMQIPNPYEQSAEKKELFDGIHAQFSRLIVL